MTSPKKIVDKKEAPKKEATRRTIGQKAACSFNIVEQKLRNSPVFICLIIFTALLLFAVLFLNLLAGNPEISHGLFVRGISTVSYQYPLDITPAGWAFSIWGVIYLHQFAWVIYNLALICRTTNNGPAYLNPVILSPAFLIFFNLSSAFNIGWLFLWDRILFMASLVFLACITLSLFLTFAIICIRVAMFKDVLVDQGRNVDLNFLNIAVVNGIGMYATWSTVATVINLGVVLTYKWRHPIYSENSSIICMGVLSFLFAIYIILDLTTFEKYTRYALAPYAVMIWALAAIISKNYNPSNVSFVMATVLLGVASLAFLLKLGLTAYRSKSLKYQYRQMRRGRPLVDEQ